MAYEKYEWHKGEIITSDKLNNMENRIEEAASSGGERFIIECTLSDDTDETLTHNVTIQEAHDAFESGKEIWLKINYTNYSSSIRFQQVEQTDNLIGFVGVGFGRTGYNIFMFNKDNEITRMLYTVDGSSTSDASEPIVFNTTIDAKSGNIKNIVCNYTYNKIKEMSQNPTIPLTATMITWSDDNIVGTASGYSIEAYTDEDFITFSRLAYSNSKLINYTIIYHSDGSVDLSNSTIVSNESNM